MPIHNKKILLVLGSLILLLAACKPGGTSTKSNKIKLKLFYGPWKVTAFRFTDGRVMPGEYMGNPQYDFTEDGLRIKTLNEDPAPPPETVRYKIENDSIKYPDNPKYPVMKIAKLKADTLVLENDKLSWFLHK